MINWPGHRIPESCLLLSYRKKGIIYWKIIFKNNEWILVRLSGTEPLVRIYAESKNKDSVNLLISKFSKLFIK